MPKGAIHYTGSNFKRIPRLDIVHRMRCLESQRVVNRPVWLTCAERAPPLELQNLFMKTRKVYNKYLPLTQYVLKKYPDMRFQDLYVDGNNWSKGLDLYRDDHPVMQFVTLQLRYMNQGLSKREAFRKAEAEFHGRRMELEKAQKMHMALAVSSAATQDPIACQSVPADNISSHIPSTSLPRITSKGLGCVEPMFSTGQAYLEYESSKTRIRHLEHIRKTIRNMRAKIVKQTDSKTNSIQDSKDDEKLYSLRSRAFSLPK